MTASTQNSRPSPTNTRISPAGKSAPRSKAWRSPSKAVYRGRRVSCLPSTESDSSLFHRKAAVPQGNRCLFFHGRRSGDRYPISPSRRNEKSPSRAMMMWSSSRMSNSAAACAILSVSTLSCGLASAAPEGWL